MKIPKKVIGALDNVQVSWFFLDGFPREGLKKNIVEFPTKGGVGWGGGVSAWFSTKKNKTEKKLVLKHWILPIDHFKTHLFFSIFGWGDPSQLGSWCVKPLKLSIATHITFMLQSLLVIAIWQVSEDPYHTEFVSWGIDQTLSGKFHGFLFLFWTSPYHLNS